MKQNFLVLGPPGSGKGTQAKKLAAKLGLAYFGTGDLMRKEAEAGSPEGLEFKKIWDEGQGKLIPEELVKKFVDRKLNELDFSAGVVFDGYPRTIEQAEHLQEIFTQKNVDNLKVLNLEVSAPSLIKRMSTRRICQDCKTIFQDPEKTGQKECNKCSGLLIQREEDNPDVLQKRIDVYNKESAPLIEYYKNKGNLVNIDGEPPIDEVWQKIEELSHD